MERDAWLASDEDPSSDEKYGYYLMRDPNMREFTGPRQDEPDPVTGQVATFRETKIAMVRGQKPENMLAAKVYLAFDGVRCIPHRRITSPKPLQGWYQSGNEARKGSRVRPCEADAVLTQPYGGSCAVMCYFSSPSGVLIKTPSGYSPIQDLKKGDWVWGRTVFGNARVQVTATTRHQKPEGFVVIHLEGGRSMRVTHDHPIYSTARGWINAGEARLNESLETFDENLPVHHVWGASELPKTLLRRMPAQGMAIRLLESSPSSKEAAQEMHDVRAVKYTTRRRPKVLRGLPLCGGGADGRGYEREQARNDGHKSLQARSRRPNGRESICQGTLSPISRGAQASCQVADDGERAGPHEDFRGVGPSGSIHAGADSHSRDAREHVCGLVQEPSRSQLQERLRVRGKPLPLTLGMRSGSFFNSSQHHLELRDDDLCMEADVLHSGLLHLQSAGHADSDNRGKGIPERARLFETQGVENGSTGGEDQDVGGEAYDEVRAIRVVKIEAVPGQIEVFDIQTPTGNFFIGSEHSADQQVDVLAHNCYVDAGIYGGRGSGLMSVPVGYGDYVRKQIAQMRQAAPFYLSSFTDPFLPGLENFYHNTENAMREIDRAGLPMFTLSRVAYPPFAYDLLARNPHSYAQKSLNTPDEADWKKLSPGAISLAEHMAEITELRRRGIFVSIQVNPIMAGITSHDEVETLLEMLAEAGANHAIFKMVETSQPQAQAMIDKTALKFGDNRAAIFRDLFVENNCGSQRTITEEYRREGFARYTRKATALGMTAALCYEYGRDPTHPTGWRSIGPEYKTTPNCHGPASVMYTRSRTHSDSGKPVAFREVTECPPSGCLSCAKENEGAPRCGNATAGLALAKVFKDFKEAVT